MYTHINKVNYVDTINKANYVHTLNRDIIGLV